MTEHPAPDVVALIEARMDADNMSLLAWRDFHTHLVVAELDDDASHNFRSKGATLLEALTALAEQLARERGAAIGRLQRDVIQAEQERDEARRDVYRKQSMLWEAEHALEEAQEYVWICVQHNPEGKTPKEEAAIRLLYDENAALLARIRDHAPEPAAPVIATETAMRERLRDLEAKAQAVCAAKWESEEQAVAFEALRAVLTKREGEV